jgi:type IV pilus assembly protein PilQ
MQFRRRIQWAGVPILLLLVGLAAGCASGPTQVASAGTGGGGAPAVLTGATLLADGGTPRLLLSGNGHLTPTLYSRDGQTRVVVDLADVVVSSGLEPPRADGAVLSKVEMRSFSEMGKPHVQFELVATEPMTARIQGEAGASTAAVLLEREAPVTVAAAPEPAPAKTPEPPAVVAESRPPARTAAASTVSSPPAAVDMAPVPVRHPAAGKPATRLSSIGLKRAHGTVTVVLAGNGSFAYETFVLPNPPRYVIDLPDVVNAAGKKSHDVEAPSLYRVRVSQFRGGPDPVTRVVFDLPASGVEPVIAASGSGLAVTFGTQVRAARAVPAASEPAAREAAPPPAASVPQPAPPSPPAAALSAVPAAGSYERHETEDPAEKVVPASAATTAGGEPAPAMTTEAVAPAQKPAAAEPTPAESGESVSPPPEAAGKPAVASQAVTAGPQTAAPPPPQAEAARMATEPPSPAPAKVVASAAPAPAAVKVEAPPRIVAASPEVQVVKQPPPRPAPSRTKIPSAEDQALVEAAEALLNQQPAGTQSKELQSSFETRTLGAGERQYTGDPITLNLKDADIKDTLQRFSELTQLNIVLDPDVRGTVTVSLTDVPWDQALELILRINQLGYVIEGNVMRIASTAKLAQEEQARLQFLRAQDQSRPLKTVLQRCSYADAGAIATIARKIMSPRGDILVDTRTQTLIIKELPDYLPTVLDLIRNLDIPNLQVMIETRIVEATRTFSQSLGIVWGFNAVSDAAHGNTTGLVFPNNGSVTGLVALPSGAPAVLNLAAGNVLDTFKLDASIHAAEARGLVKVISTPKVQTQTGEEASIQSGFQIPVQTTVNNTTTVLYINATLRLQVVPNITTEGTITMDVTVQKREPAVGINIAQGQNIPLTTRDAKTRLMVRDGGTAVIGGIFKLTTNDAQNMIPGLWKIPLIGNLFRSRDINDTSDELMIFITPRIIR